MTIDKARKIVALANEEVRLQSELSSVQFALHGETSYNEALMCGSPKDAAAVEAAAIQSARDFVAGYDAAVTEGIHQ